MSLPRIAKFVISGGLATGVHTATMYMLLFLTVEPHVAFSAGFLLAVVLRFFVDRNVVFEAGSGTLMEQFPRYVAACLFHYAISVSTFALFVDALSWKMTASFIMAVCLSTAVAYFAINFALTGGRRTQS